MRSGCSVAEVANTLHLLRLVVCSVSSSCCCFPPFYSHSIQPKTHPPAATAFLLPLLILLPDASATHCIVGSTIPHCSVHPSLPFFFYSTPNFQCNDDPPGLGDLARSSIFSTSPLLCEDASQAASSCSHLPMFSRRNLDLDPSHSPFPKRSTPFLFFSWLATSGLS